MVRVVEKPADPRLVKRAQKAWHNVKIPSPAELDHSHRQVARRQCQQHEKQAKPRPWMTAKRRRQQISHQRRAHDEKILPRPQLHRRNDRPRRDVEREKQRRRQTGLIRRKNHAHAPAHRQKKRRQTHEQASRPEKQHARLRRQNTRHDQCGAKHAQNQFFHAREHKGPAACCASTTLTSFKSIVRWRFMLR